MLVQQGNETVEVKDIELYVSHPEPMFIGKAKTGEVWNEIVGFYRNLIVTPEELPLDLYADDYYTEEVEAVNQYNQDVLILRDYAYDWQQEVTEELRALWMDAA